MRTGTAISVFVHVAALIVCLVLAGVRPFEPTTAEAITVDIVTPEEAPPLPKEPDPKYDLPTLAEKDQQTTPEKAPQPPQEQQPAPPPPAAQKNAAAESKQEQQQAALKPSATEPSKPVEPPKPPEPSKQQPQSQQQPQEQPEAPAAEPDITSKFGTMFAMPDLKSGDFDAKASANANISAQETAALREHLKSCSILPRSVSASDNVRVVLRVSLQQNGRLAREPLLIEASASAKGPALMQAAMEGLTKCQPYAMLPADRYNEWRMLDLSFTPKDFKGG